MLAFILSQPRSGSTVLSAMLDKRKGVVCMPESSFPQVLGAISKKERADKRWLAGLYRGSTFPPCPDPPTPLTIADAEACMDGKDDDILFSLGKAIAVKLGKDPRDVRHVIWKTTRTIGLHKGPLATMGTFVVLRRDMHNVFDSQFRVAFGIRNRNPWRYAIFAHSYENAFSRIPKSRRFELDYESIPREFESLIQFLGVEDRGEWETGISSIDLVAKSGSWLKQATETFRSTDDQKRASLDHHLITQLDFALKVSGPLVPALGPLRRYFDMRSLGHIRNDAAFQLNKWSALQERNHA